MSCGHPKDLAFLLLQSPASPIPEKKSVFTDEETDDPRAESLQSLGTFAGHQSLAQPVVSPPGAPSSRWGWLWLPTSRQMGQAPSVILGYESRDTDPPQSLSTLFQA